MLVLTRKPGEAVEITDDNTGQLLATIHVLGVKGGGQVRIGFHGEPHVKFMRDELVERDRAADRR